MLNIPIIELDTIIWYIDLKWVTLMKRNGLFLECSRHIYEIIENYEYLISVRKEPNNFSARVGKGLRSSSSGVFLFLPKGTGTSRNLSNGSSKNTCKRVFRSRGLFFSITLNLVALVSIAHYTRNSQIVNTCQSIMNHGKVQYK